MQPLLYNTVLFRPEVASFCVVESRRRIKRSRMIKRACLSAGPPTIVFPIITPLGYGNGARSRAQSPGTLLVLSAPVTSLLPRPRETRSSPAKRRASLKTLHRYGRCSSRRRRRPRIAWRPDLRLPYPARVSRRRHRSLLRHLRQNRFLDVTRFGAFARSQIRSLFTNNPGNVG